MSKKRKATSAVGTVKRGAKSSAKVIAGPPGPLNFIKRAEAVGLDLVDPATGKRRPPSVRDRQELEEIEASIKGREGMSEEELLQALEGVKQKRLAEADAQFGVTQEGEVGVEGEDAVTTDDYNTEDEAVQQALRDSGAEWEPEDTAEVGQTLEVQEEPEFDPDAEKTAPQQIGQIVGDMISGKIRTPKEPSRAEQFLAANNKKPSERTPEEKQLVQEVARFYKGREKPVIDELIESGIPEKNIFTPAGNFKRSIVRPEPKKPKGAEDGGMIELENGSVTTERMLVKIKEKDPTIRTKAEAELAKKQSKPGTRNRVNKTLDITDEGTDSSALNPLESTADQAPAQAAKVTAKGKPNKGKVQVAPGQFITRAEWNKLTGGTKPKMYTLADGSIVQADMWKKNQQAFGPLSGQKAQPAATGAGETADSFFGQGGSTPEGLQSNAAAQQRFLAGNQVVDDPLPSPDATPEELMQYEFEQYDKNFQRSGDTAKDLADRKAFHDSLKEKYGLDKVKEPEPEPGKFRQALGKAGEDFARPFKTAAAWAPGVAGWSSLVGLGGYGLYQYGGPTLRFIGDMMGGETGEGKGYDRIQKAREAIQAQGQSDQIKGIFQKLQQAPTSDMPPPTTDNIRELTNGSTT